MLKDKRMRYKILYLFVVVAVLVSHSTFAQRGGIPVQNIPPVDITTALQTTVMMLDNISEIRDKEATQLGSFYLKDEWVTGSVLTASGHIIKDIKLKYDLKNNIVEISLEDEVKVISGEYVQAFRLHTMHDSSTSVFVNAKAYRAGSNNGVGFFEVLTSGGKAELLKKTELQNVQPNYTAILDVGNRTARVEKKGTLYLATPDKVALPLDRNDYNLFGKYKDEVKKYAKSNKLKLNREEDAIILITYYNTL